MKYKLFIIILLITSIQNSWAYLPMCYKGRIHHYKMNAGLGQFIDNYMTIQCDTLINNVAYFKVFRCDKDGDNQILKGFIREDTLSQKVYYKGVDSLNEQLSFNFSLKVNDTIQRYFSNTLIIAYVDSIKTEFLFGQNRRVIYYDNWMQSVEGIGSYFWGFLDSPHGTGMLGTNRIENAYLVPEKCSPVSIANQTFGSIKIYPNPATSKLNIELKNHNESVKFDVFNMQGAVIKKGNLGVNNTIDISELSSGVYFLSLRGNEGVLTSRFRKD